MIVAVLAALLAGLFAQQPGTAVIEGVVHRAGTDVPVAGAQVNAFPAPQGTLLQTISDAEGRFRLVVGPGRYQVTATKQGFTPPVARAGETIPAVSVTAFSGQAASIDIQMIPTGTITGRVFDPEGRVMEGVTVGLSRLGWTGEGQRILQPVNFGARTTVTTNDLGEYRLYWIPPGDYYLTARDNSGPITAGFSQKYLTTYYPGAVTPREANTLQVPPGVELGGINLTLSRMRSTIVRGRLVSPVADVADSVTVMSMAPVDESMVADPVPVNFNYVSKTFAAQNVIPGRYRILATLRIPNKFNLSGEAIVNVGEEPIDNVVVSVTPSQRLAGRLQIEDSSPEVRAAVEAGKVTVNLRADPSGAFLSTSGAVRKDGNFTLDDVGVVHYNVSTFGLPADAYVASARLGGADILEKGFTLHGDAPGPLDISVSGAGGRIVGVVRTPQNEIVSAGRVVLIPEPGLRDRTDLFKTATLDQYGRFNIQGITPGRYKLFAWDNVPIGAYFDSEFLQPYEAQAKAVTVEKNDYIQAEIILTQRAVKTGELLNR